MRMCWDLPILKQIKPISMKPEERRANLRTYVNDMIAVERDVHNAISGQTKDSRVEENPEVHRLLQEIAEGSEIRLQNLEDLSVSLDGKWGALVKEAVAATTGVLAGLYGMVRKHPVSRMLRDDHVALNLSATAYGMLYTTAVAYDEDEVAVIALDHLNAIPSQILRLTHLLPGVVMREVTNGDPLNPDAEKLASEAIEAAWSDAEAAV